MNAHKQKLKEIKKHLRHIKKSAEEGVITYNSLEQLDDNQYNQAIGKIEYWKFLQFGDYHYFVARILFLHHIREYSFFAAHQCIESYLKSFLKLRKKIPPRTHSLRNLLGECRKFALKKDSFIRSVYLTIIVDRYDPFYELPRYPIQRTRPHKGMYGSEYPTDIYVLDYFIFRMREILTIPKNTYDLIRSKNHIRLIECKEYYPDLYRLFFSNNVNFPNS